MAFVECIFSDLETAELARSKMILKIHEYGYMTVEESLQFSGCTRPFDIQDKISGWNKIEDIPEVKYVSNLSIWCIYLEDPKKLSLSDLKKWKGGNIMNKKDIKLGMGDLAGVLVGLTVYDIIQTGIGYRKATLIYTVGKTLYGVAAGVLAYNAVKKLYS